MAAPLRADPSCLIKRRKRVGTSQRRAASVMKRWIYSAALSSLHPLHQLLIAVRSLSSSLPSRLVLPVLPPSFRSQTPTGGGADPSAAIGAPREFPRLGSGPAARRRCRRCEFFMCVNVSGGQEFTFRPVKTGPRSLSLPHTHTRAHTHTHTTQPRLKM